jgi:anhydro-N-acetylmuramic acid kinase
VLAFDTGPGNMVVDAVTEKLFGKPFDRDGRMAASGTPIDGVLRYFLDTGFFRRQPPKTAGREEFGSGFVRTFLERCGGAGEHDIVATATALTARSIANSLKRFVLPRQFYRDFIVSGGGTRNATLLAMLANQLSPLGLQVRCSDEFGLPSEAKEAAAFALLAYETWHRRPSNVASATGARRAAVLGKVSYV